MSKSLKNLFISMEEESNDLNQTTLEVSADNTMEEEVAEVTEAGIEVIEAEDDVEELHEIAEGLESIVASLESAVEEGGLDTQAAVFMQHAVDGYTTRVGLEATAIVPSLESFGGASGKAAATTISLEGIKETIKKIWQAIKNAVAKAITAVKNFFAKLFGGVDKLISRAEALKNSVNGLGNDKKAKNKIKVPAANHLHVGGKVDAASIIKGLGETRSAIETGVPTLVAASIKYYDQVSAKVASSEFQKIMEESAIEKELETAKTNWVSTSGTITARTKEMSGGAYMEATSEIAAADTQAGGKRADGGTVAIPKLKFKGSANEGQEIDALSKDQMKKAVDDVLAVLKTMKNKKKDFEDLSKAREEAVKKTDNFVKAGEGGKLGQGWTQVKVRLALRSANADLTSIINQLSRHGFSVSRAALALVDRSLAAYS